LKKNVGCRSWFVYIILSSDDRLYTGITTDINRRWDEHAGLKTGAAKGAKFFRGRTPVEILFLQEADDRSLVSKIEAQIKKLPRTEKIKLIESGANQLNKFSHQLNSKIRCRCVG
jgi:putative endonuclease